MMTGEIKEGGQAPDDEGLIPPVPERHDPVAEVTEPETQPEVGAVEEGAQTPEAEGQEFDYEAEMAKADALYEKRIKEISESFEDRREKAKELIKEIFGTPSVEHRADGVEDFKFIVSHATSDSLAEKDKLALELDAKIRQVDSEEKEMVPAMEKEAALELERVHADLAKKNLENRERKIAEI